MATFHRRPGAGPEGVAPAAIAAIESRACYGAGATIIPPEAPAEYWFRLVTGAARECVLLADGSRQIIDFLLPGDAFGFDGERTHHFSSEVIEDRTTVARYSRREVQSLARSHPEVACHMCALSFRTIQRLHARLVLLGRQRALEKVSAFLLELFERTAAADDDKIRLPMTRYDIADYLALAVETVSRSFTTLRRRGVIALRGVRQIRILDRPMLEEAAGYSRHVLQQYTREYAGFDAPVDAGYR